MSTDLGDSDQGRGVAVLAKALALRRERGVR